VEGLTIYNNNKNNKKINPSFSSDFFSDSSSFIDLIQGNICDRNEKNLYKIEQAKKRLEKKKFCGQTGHVTYFPESEKFVYQPHSCNAVTCPYCAVRESKRILSRYVDYFIDLIKKRKKIGFVTLTIKSSFNLKEVYDKLSKSLRKLYEYSLFGKRN